jgi:hypothetical protein
VAAIRRVLENSPHPLTLSKLRAQLPAALRTISLEDLAALLQRQVTAGVFVQYPKYRSQQDRFWDRPMPVHVAQLIQETLQESPLTLSELRRKLPDYAKTQMDAIVEYEAQQGTLHRHPVVGRGGPRYGVRPAEPKDYLRSELTDLFHRLEQLGFNRSQLRHGALELLHEEEWETPVETPSLRRDAPHENASQAPHETANTPASTEQA